MLGRVATVEDVWLLTLTYTWDAGDRLTALDDELGGAQDFVYDNANRNTQRKFDDSTTQVRLDLVYNNRNQVTELRRYADLTATTLLGKTLYTIDDASRVTAIVHQNASATTLDSFSYTLDAANRVTQETSTLGPTRNYTYDVTSQLTGDGANTWSYDANGNRTMTGYTTGDGNRLTSDGTWSYSYDDEGNVTSKVHASTTETWLYTYNHKNQLVKAEHKATSAGAVDSRVEFKYDVFGNRLERSVDSDGDGAGTAVVGRFAYNVGIGDPSLANAWADLNGSSSLTTRRLNLDAVDAVFARIDDADNLDWYLTDRLGSIRDLMDDASTIQDHIDYDGFGKVSSETNASYGDRYKFTGREFDSVTGLQYNRARWYSFEIGGWMSEDPIGFAAGDANLRRYVGNNAANATDPSGQVFSWILTGVGAAVGAVVGGVVGAVVYTATSTYSGTFSLNGLGGAAAGGAVTGAVAGAITGAVAGAFAGDPSAIVAGGIIAGGVGAGAGNVVSQVITTGTVNPQQVAVATGIGMVTGGLGSTIQVAASAGGSGGTAILAGVGPHGPIANIHSTPLAGSVVVNGAISGSIVFATTTGGNANGWNPNDTVVDDDDTLIDPPPNGTIGPNSGSPPPDFPGPHPRPPGPSPAPNAGWDGRVGMWYYVIPHIM